MKNIKIIGYVNMAIDNIIVRVFDNKILTKLQEIGFEEYIGYKKHLSSATSDIYYISRGMPPASEYATQHLYFEIKDDKEKASIFQTLNKLGFAFVGGKEWNPIEVYEYLYEKYPNILSNTYKEIKWKSSKSFFITEIKC